jgi:fatty-acyl-CoA synthase
MTERPSLIDGPPLGEEPGLGALTLPGFLAEIAEKHAQREALYWRDLSGVDRRWTYAQLLEESEKVARSLLASGIGKDARVGVLISNRPEWLFAMFGAAMAGAVTVALNTFSTQPELMHQLKVADVELLITEAGVASRDFVTDLSALCPALANTEPGTLKMEELPFLRRVVCIDDVSSLVGLQSWSDFLAAGDVIPPSIAHATSASVSPVDHGLIFFSSGSTALPKAILQSHRAAALQCWRFGKWFEIDSSARTWAANGFFFSGNIAQAFGTLSVGGCLVLLRYFDPDAALELIQSEKVTSVVAWPHQEARLRECPGWEGADFSALRTINTDSEFRSHPTVDIDGPGINGYGMTETFTFVTGVSGTENTSESHGIVLPGNQMRIVDPETGEAVPFGTLGEIIVKGPTVMIGYLKVPAEETFDGEGFLHTADAGYLTEDGHLYWKGRLSDIIKTGGANVSPTEVDAVLFEHPAVQTVNTVGVPHDTLGEIVVACVVLHDGKRIDEDGLRTYAKDFLASYKVPRKVLFFSEDELPTTGSNKVRHSDLVVVAAKRLEQEG